MTHQLSRTRPYAVNDRVVAGGDTGTVTRVDYIMIPDAGGTNRRHYSGVAVKLDNGGERDFALPDVQPMRYPRCAHCGQANDGENVYWTDGSFYCRLCGGTGKGPLACPDCGPEGYSAAEAPLVPLHTHETADGPLFYARCTKQCGTVYVRRKHGDWSAALPDVQDAYTRP